MTYGLKVFIRPRLPYATAFAVKEIESCQIDPGCHSQSCTSTVAFVCVGGNGQFVSTKGAQQSLDFLTTPIA